LHKTDKHFHYLVQAIIVIVVLVIFSCVITTTIVKNNFDYIRKNNSASLFDMCTNETSDTCNLEKWIGKYLYNESFPPNITITYTIDIYNEDGLYLADFFVEGFQIEKQFTSYLLGNDTYIDFIYDSKYDSGSLYDDGTVLMSFAITDGVLRTYWKELNCNMQNRYFRKSYSEVEGTWEIDEAYYPYSQQNIKFGIGDTVSIDDTIITIENATLPLTIQKNKMTLYPDFLLDKGVEELFQTTIVRDLDYDTVYNEFVVFDKSSNVMAWIYPVSETALLMLDKDFCLYRLVLSN